MAVQHERRYTSRQILSTLITSIPSTPAAQHGQNPLRDLPIEARNIFLTLYAQFEKELLPALDLLDRGLVTRLHIKRTNPEDSDPQGSAPKAIYLVRSAQQHHTRHGTVDHGNHYEVHLEAWSCSCPAFTFSAFPAAAPTSTNEANTASASSSRIGGTTLTSPDPRTSQPPCIFGGVTRGEDTPACKHLLACVLVQNCAMFAGFVEQREVSLEELAGWAAGWGD